MKYPKLVRQSDCKIPVEVHFYTDDLNEDGEQIEIDVINAFCNYQEEKRNENTEKKSISRGNGKIYFYDDIIPQYENVNNGYALILGNKRQISQVIKARNPDGTVNYLRLDVI